MKQQRLTLDRVKLCAILIAVGLFASWEILKHLFLMNVSMATNHFISTLVEACFAVIVVSYIVHMLGIIEMQKRMAERLASIVAGAVGSSASMSKAVESIASSAFTLRRLCGPGDDEKREALDTIYMETERIRKAIHTLEAMNHLTREEAMDV